jgi:hypothetical protein
MKENIPFSRDNITKLFFTINHQNHGMQTPTSIKNGGIEQNPTSGRDASTKAQMVKIRWSAALRMVTELESSRAPGP